MTHKEKWLEVAEAFLTPKDDRTPRQYRLSQCGICMAIAIVTDDWNEMGTRAFTLLGIFLQESNENLFWIHSYIMPENDQIRGLMASLISNIPEDEYLELCRKED